MRLIGTANIMQPLLNWPRSWNGLVGIQRPQRESHASTERRMDHLGTLTPDNYDMINECIVLAILGISVGKPCFGPN